MAAGVDKALHDTLFQLPQVKKIGVSDYDINFNVIIVKWPSSRFQTHASRDQQDSP